MTLNSLVLNNKYLLYGSFGFQTQDSIVRNLDDSLHVQSPGIQLKCRCFFMYSSTPVITHCTMIRFLKDKTTILLRGHNDIKLFFAFSILIWAFVAPKCTLV